jgi:hypothetical protein
MKYRWHFRTGNIRVNRVNPRQDSVASPPPLPYNDPVISVRFRFEPTNAAATSHLS